MSCAWINFQTKRIDQSVGMSNPSSHARVRRLVTLLGWWKILALIASVTAESLGLPPRAETFQAHRASDANASPPSVDNSDRMAMRAYYHNVYRASVGVPMDWNGSVADCLPGTNGWAYIEATLLRVNYFRGMAGLPSVIDDPDWNRKSQAAALMMAAEARLSHHPGQDWACWSAEGAEAAGKSNLYHGRGGPEAIDGYMDDFGEENYFVGHRRWILYPPQQRVGTGSVPTADGRIGANCLWVIGGAGARPDQPSVVAWPPAGFVPFQILPKVSRRWSFSVAGADFASAWVTMRRSGTNVPVIIERLENDRGYGDNSIVWVPQSLPDVAPAEDINYEVEVGNYRLGDAIQNYSYRVTIFDGDAPIYGPRFTLEPESQTVVFGSQVTLRVEAEGTPPLYYQWYFQSELLPDQTSKQLVLGRVTSAHAGAYRVVVSNQVDSVASRIAWLTVLEPEPLKFTVISLEGNGISLHWKGVGTLQQAAEVSGPWTDLVGVTSPIWLPRDGGFAFFRLRGESQRP